MKLIVGLGNPGKEYERTRHNVGWKVLDTLTDDWQESKKAEAFYSKTEIDGKRVELLRPNTYMNNSGAAVAYAAKKHSLAPDDVIVVHDDKDIPLGETRVQKGRGAAGHNGVQSIIDHLGTKDFTRIRVGIGLPLPTGEGQGVRDRANTADFVLGKFSKEEQKVLKIVIEDVLKEIQNLIK